MSLTKQSCEACRVGAPLATVEEIKVWMEEIPQWQLVSIAGEQQLTRRFDFDDFAQAIDFTNQIARFAEAQGHHPAILTEWGSVTVNWWTHKIKGLHKNDFICAANTDALYST